jgi:tetratricopeptide (TPR) repeat protein
MDEQEEKKFEKGIRYHFLTKKLGELRTLEKGLPVVEVEKRRVVSYWKPLAIAAGVLLTLTFIFLFTRPETPGQLFAANFEPYPNVFEPQQRDVAAPATARGWAFAVYEKKDYDEASRLFQQLFISDNEPEVLLLLGNANLANDHTDEAINNFLNLINSFDALTEQAKWYLSLCYLKKGDVEKAKQTLKELTGSDNVYSEKAVKLLNQLK